jgi:hypothetical protein
VLPAVFWYQYFAGIRFIWRSVFPVGITNLAGTPFFRKRGAGCNKKGAGAPFFLKKGAIASFLREIGFPAKKIIPKCTDQDFLRYRYSKYREIPTDTNREIPIRYTTLLELDLAATDPSPTRWGMQHLQRTCWGLVGYSKQAGKFF